MTYTFKISFPLALVAGFFITSYTVFAATLFGPDETIVGVEAEYTTGIIDASGYENLQLTFDYIAEKLDTGDSFTYGWRSGGDEHILNTFNGLPDGATAIPGDETGTIVVALPNSAAVTDLEIFIYVSANSTITNDNTEITNLKITGDLIVLDEDGDGVIEGDMCPHTVTDSAGSEKLNPNHWRYDGVSLIKGLNKQGRGSDLHFSIFDTKGCGCDQIITIFSSYTGYDYKGHRKFGCGEDLMVDFSDFLTTI